MGSPQRFPSGISTGARGLPVGYMPVPDMTKWNYFSENFMGAIPVATSTAATAVSAGWNITNVVAGTTVGGGVTTTSGISVAGLAVAIQASNTSAAYISSTSSTANTRGNTVYLRKDKEVILSFGYSIQTALASKIIQIGLVQAADAPFSLPLLGMYWYSLGPIGNIYLSGTSAAVGPTITTAVDSFMEVQMRWKSNVLSGMYRRRSLTAGGTDTGWLSAGTVSTTGVGTDFDVANPKAVQPFIGCSNGAAATAATVIFDYYQLAIER